MDNRHGRRAVKFVAHKDCGAAMAKRKAQWAKWKEEEDGEE